MRHPFTKAEAERYRDEYRAGTRALPTDKNAIADRWQRVVDTIEADDANLAAVEKERDEARNGPVYVMYCNAMHARRKAEEERDAATGALAEAMVVLRRASSIGEIHFRTNALARGVSEEIAALLSSPAADLAARHDADSKGQK